MKDPGPARSGPPASRPPGPQDRPAPGAGRPNIVFVFADEWRGQAAGFAGDPNALTPNLDALARESAEFTHAVAGCPVCCPYRASLMTGQYPLTHGVFINDVELPPSAPSIARAFSEHGYRTAYIGKWHLYGSPGGAYERRKVFVPRSHQLGFDFWKGYECCHDYHRSPYFFNDDPTPRLWEGYDAFDQSREAAAYIEGAAGGGEPFLLMLSWGPPHFPLHTAPPEYRRAYQDRSLVLRENVPPALAEKAVQELRGYYAHIAALDEALGTVLKSVERAGIRDRTIFVFTSDHGDMRQSQGLDTKLFPFEESIRVPFLLRFPRLAGQAGRKIPIPLDAPDLMPTLLGLAGLPIPSTAEGLDFSPVLRGERAVKGDEAAFLIMASEFTEILQNGMRAYRGLRSARYTYVRDTAGPWLLYDNQNDPFQKHNLVGQSEGVQIQEFMENTLRERLAQREDAFLPGRAYLERFGLTHYREVQLPVKRVWRDPWTRREGEV